MATDSFLMTCETFYSIQGEGKTAGTPAVFLRLAGCNLQCNGFSYQDPVSQEHLGCDSKQLWRRGQRTNFETIIANWQQQGWLEKLEHGAHLVITGGEPLLQQRALTAFLQHLDRQLTKKIHCEIETNATVQVDSDLLKRINQFNVSPKLLHSGESRQKAHKPAVIQQFADSQHANFKFVIATPQDVDEVIETYMKPFSLSPQRIWLMPEGGTQESINAKKPWLVELCKQHLFHFTTRLQVDIWGEVVGV